MRVSAVVATYNRADFLPRAIASIRAQTVPVEIVVVDDGSSDRTPSVLRELAGPDLVVLRNPKNRERAVSRNRGVQASSGELIAMLDSDDEWLPTHVEEACEVLSREPGCGLVYSPSFFVREGRVVHVGPLDPLASPREALPQGNAFAFSSVVMRRSLFEMVGGFRDDPELLTAEDWELWVRCAANGRLGFSPRPTVRIHLHGANSVTDAARHERALRRAFEIIGTELPPESRTRPRERHREAALLIAIARAHLDAGDWVTAWARLRAALSREPRHLSDPAVMRTVSRTLLRRR